MTMTSDPTFYYPIARRAVLTLRQWLIHAYSIRPQQLPIRRAITLDALYDAVTRRRLCGYDLSRAPADMVEPIRLYLTALKGGPIAADDPRRFTVTVLRRHNALIIDRPRRPRGAA